MQSQPLISTEKIKPDRPERKIWPRPVRPELFLKCRPMPYRPHRQRQRLNRPATLQGRIRRNLYRSLPWPLDRKKPKRKG